MGSRIMVIKNGVAINCGRQFWKHVRTLTYYGKTEWLLIEYLLCSVLLMDSIRC